MSQHNPEVITEQQESTPARGRISRFLGISALKGRERAEQHSYIEAEVESGEIVSLFGLEEQLAAYGEAWVEHQEHIAQFRDDPDSQQVLQNLIRGAFEDENTSRQARKFYARIKDRDYGAFVSVAVLSGRLNTIFHAVKDLWVHADPEENKAFKSDYVTYNHAQAAFEGIFSNLSPSTQPEIFRSKLKDFESGVSKTYKPILKAESNILRSLRKKTDSPVHAIRLIDTVALGADSYARDEKNLASIIIHDHLRRNSRSLLSQSMRILESSEAKQYIIDQFLSTNTSENNGDNALAYFSGMLQRLNPDVSVLEVIKADFDAWPSDLRRTYADFEQQFMSAKRTALHRALDVGIQKTKLRPTADMYAEEVHRLLRTIAPSAAPKAKHHSTEKLKITTNEITGISRESNEVERKLYAVRKVDNEFISHAAEDVDSMVGAIITKNTHDKSMITEIKRIVSDLAINPGEVPNVKSITRRSVTIDGKKMRILRTEFTRESGRGGRIVFSLDKRNVYILAIEPDHDKYLKFIKTV